MVENESFIDDSKEIRNDQMNLLSFYSTFGCVISLLMAILTRFMWVLMFATPVISGISIIIFAIVVWKSIKFKFFNKVIVLSIIIGIIVNVYNVCIWIKYWPPFTEP